LLTVADCPESLWRSEISFFAVELVILKGEKCEFRAAFVPIALFLKTSISLVSKVVGGPMIRLDLGLRHAGDNLLVIGEVQLRTGKRVSIAASR
jgi:hypothetical protein